MVDLEPENVLWAFALFFWQFLCRRGRHYAIFQIQFEDHWIEKLVTLEYSGLANMIKSESLCSISLKSLYRKGCHRF